MQGLQGMASRFWRGAETVAPCPLPTPSPGARCGRCRARRPRRRPRRCLGRKRAPAARAAARPAQMRRRSGGDQAEIRHTRPGGRPKYTCGPQPSAVYSLCTQDVAGLLEDLDVALVECLLAPVQPPGRRRPPVLLSPRGVACRTTQCRAVQVAGCARGTLLSVLAARPEQAGGPRKRKLC